MPNSLASSLSPYLLQHANNPVDWREWSVSAFEEAAQRDVPVLISIGYSACHWCHVMERESFEDPLVAQVMNAGFVCVKVDREERPDVDAVYMDAVQAMTGHGGWPMTVFATPDGTPFVGGTYFPPSPRHGMPSFQQLMAQVSELWKTRRLDVVAHGKQMVERMSFRPAPCAIASGVFEEAARRIASDFDPVHGGFGGAPKFPQAPVLELALELGLEDVIRGTLDAMAYGGIYDQLAGGFSRYTVDREWTVPHFEKMLYDNAQLARLYTHAWQRYRDPLYKRIAIETCEYLMREMQDECGGFHASEDADSEGVEGKFYVWTCDEFLSVAADAASYYEVSAGGNFEGVNILRATPGSAVPADARALLLTARSTRTRPARDDKVLTSWNGMAIAALAETGACFERPDIVDAARVAAGFILGLALHQETDLSHTFRAGQAQIFGLLEDYAFVVDGLLELWNATLEREYLDRALGLSRRAVELFAQGDQLLPTTAELVAIRSEVIESATPSPAGVLVGCLLRLGVILDDAELTAFASQALKSAGPYAERAPQAVPTWIRAANFERHGATEIALTDTPQSGSTLSPLGTVVAAQFLPHKALSGGDNPDLPGMRDKKPGFAYICRGHACRPPISDPEKLAHALTASLIEGTGG